MGKQELITKKLTPEEDNLIESIRNYNKSYPDGYPQLLFYIEMQLEQMTRRPYDSNH